MKIAVVYNRDSKNVINLFGIPNRERIGHKTIKRISDALKAETARFDASDLMPSAVGGGSFWTGMVDYTRNGPSSLDGILAEIDASWPAS